MAINHANFAETTLGAAITTTDGTSITVSSSAGFPNVDFIIAIDTEVMLVTNVSGTTWTVTRGYESSTAATHLNGATVYHNISAGEADSIATKAPLASPTFTGTPTAPTAAAATDTTQVATTAFVHDVTDTLVANPMTAALNAGNYDLNHVKMLLLNSLIDDGNSGTSKTIDWNLGIAHKSTLTGNVTFAFTGYGPDITPTMTANDAPSGVASASSDSGSGYEAFRIMDGVTTNSRWWPTNGATPSWVQYQFTEAKTVITYDIVAFNVYGPSEWKLQGSNNGSSWNDLDVRTGISAWGSYERRYYTVTTPGSYIYYRLAITGGTYGGFSEWELMDTGISNPAAPCFLTLKLVQDGTGGRTVTWPATVKGSPVINQAANAVSNVLFYWDGTNYWTLNGLPWVAAPAAANSAGFVGQMAWDTSYFYICTAANTWKRAAIATW